MDGPRTRTVSVLYDVFWQIAALTHTDEISTGRHFFSKRMNPRFINEPRVWLTAVLISHHYSGDVTLAEGR